MIKGNGRENKANTDHMHNIYTYMYVHVHIIYIPSKVHLYMHVHGYVCVRGIGRLGLHLSGQ